MKVSAATRRGRGGDVERVNFWSFTMRCPGLDVGSIVLPTFICAAVPTTNSQPRWTLGPNTWLSIENGGALLPVKQT